MSSGVVIGLVLIVAIVTVGFVYFGGQADKKRKTQRQAEKASKKAEAAANRAAWEKWRNK